MTSKKKIFRDFQDKAEVHFFNKDDYRLANLELFQTTWTGGKSMCIIHRDDEMHSTYYDMSDESLCEKKREREKVSRKKGSSSKEGKE
jgi:hypothetical protein